MFTPVTFSCSSFPCQGPSSSQPAPLLINFFSILLTLCVIGITFMSLGWDYWSMDHLPVATPWEKSPPLATADKALAEEWDLPQQPLPTRDAVLVGVFSGCEPTSAANSVPSMGYCPVLCLSHPSHPSLPQSFLSLGQRVI